MDQDTPCSFRSFPLLSESVRYHSFIPCNMRFFFAAALLAASLAKKASAAMPDKIYGVNLGSWLLLEPWMLPEGMVAHFIQAGTV